MNRDDIIRMAREHLVKSEYTEFGWQECHRYEFDDDELLHFAALVAAHEREACAKECETLLPSQRIFDQRYYEAIEDCVATIRERSEV